MWVTGMVFGGSTEDDALSGLGVTVGGRCWRLQESYHSRVVKRTSRPEWCLAVVS